jgi:hypothetical protein
MRGDFEADKKKALKKKFGARVNPFSGLTSVQNSIHNITEDEEKGFDDDGKS